MRKKEKMLTKRAISFFEIAVMICASFAFCYMIEQQDKVIDEKLKDKREEIKNFEKEIHNKKIIAIASFFGNWLARSKIGTVSAQTADNITFDWQSSSYQLSCCTKLKNNAVCQDVLSSRCSEDCAGVCLPTKCEKTSSCKLGCCFDSNEGICANSVPKEKCESSSGKWSESNNCEIQECNLGCCVLGKNAQFITAKRCEKLSAFYGFDIDFRANLRTEIECLALSESQEEGACILQDNGCKFVTKQECLKLTGNSVNFYQDYLCSNTQLNTTCLRQSKTSCVEGKDEIYWIDSCGNRENIYDADKEKSWNSGKVLKKEDSCFNSETCGNCNRFLGSTCARVNDKDVCRSLDCKQAIDNVGKKDRKNGESWCVYESAIGDGKDVVGSRHYKYYCLDGEVKAEGCGDFRTGICVSSEVDVGNGKKLSNAACRLNRALECSEYNSKKEKLKENCEKNEDCRMIEMNFGKGYKFAICAAKYPQGFDLIENGEMNKKICDQADFTCTKIMTKGFSGWTCEAGCDCDKVKFTEQMNNWCSSLGDCGLKSNVVGDVPEYGYTITKGKKLNPQDYKKYATPVSGQKALPGNFSDILASRYGWGVPGKSPEYKQSDPTSAIMLASVGVGGIGALAIGAAYAYASLTVASPVFMPEAFMAVLPGWGFQLAGAGIGAALGAIAGVMVAKMLGISGSPTATYILAGMGAVGGGAIGAGLVGASSLLMGETTNVLIPICVVNPATCIIVGVIILIAMLIVAGIFKALGIGEVKKIKVVFNCEQWEAPRGGEKCGKCAELNKDGLKECTKYKCQSLGQTCEFINEGTDYETCVDSSPNDVSSPIITPFKEFISPGYKYETSINDIEGFKILKEDGNCITEFTPVLFGINTNEVAQCKMDSVHTSSYDEMEYFFGDSSVYKKQHGMGFNLPNQDALLAEINKTEINASLMKNINSLVASKLGNLTYYVRCIDRKGNANTKEYVISTCVKPGPDLTAPYVTRSEPEQTSFIEMNRTEKEVKIYVNEPANCKYAKTDSVYELMNNSFVCKTALDESELYGWSCSANLTGLTEKENNIYVKCSDQPWLPETNKSRNAMKESHVLTLKKAEKKLEIALVEPEGTVKFGREPVSVQLRVVTSGGAEDGKAICSYSFTGYENMITMFNTYSVESTQDFDMLLGGNYIVYVKCLDISNDVAKKEISMNIEIDKNPPRIIRLYNSGKLKIVTDEDASCVFRNDNCYYSWVNGTTMTGIEKEHEAEIANSNYYIKCKDIWGNMPDLCSIIAKAT